MFYNSEECELYFSSSGPKEPFDIVDRPDNMTDDIGIWHAPANKLPQPQSGIVPRWALGDSDSNSLDNEHDGYISVNMM